jgi:uncharacterized membrane protein
MAVEDFHLLGFIAGMSIIVVISMLIAFVALQYKNQATAILAAVLAFSTPLIFSSIPSDYFNLTIYLLLVSIVIIWVVIYSGWSFLELVGLAWLLFYASGFYFSGESPNDIFSIVVISFVTIILYSIVCSFGIKKRGYRNL